MSASVPPPKSHQRRQLNGMYAEWYGRSGAGPMLMRGRPIAGYVLIDGKTLSGPAIREWSQLALSHVRTLPPKPVKPKTSRKKGGAK